MMSTRTALPASGPQAARVGADQIALRRKFFDKLLAGYPNQPAHEAADVYARSRAHAHRSEKRHAVHGHDQCRSRPTFPPERSPSATYRRSRAACRKKTGGASIARRSLAEPGNDHHPQEREFWLQRFPRHPR